MIKSSTRHRLHSGAAAITGLGGVLLFAACASTPPPTLEIRAAEQAISVADRTRVADTSSPELSEAREKLTAAETAAHEEKMIAARRLALESRVDAELAAAKIAAAKEQAVNTEIQHGTGTLAQEMQRNSGVK